MQEHHAYLDLMLRLARDYAESFDIIHNHSLHYLPVAMASTLSAPVLTTLHTPPTPPWLESAIAAGGSPGRFAAVSRFTADSWKQAAGDVDVVHNGVDTDQWRQGARWASTDLVRTHRSGKGRPPCDCSRQRIRYAVGACRADQ